MAERKAFLLRVDPALWAELESWAQEELRSVNGQVEYVLRQAVLRRRRGPGNLSSTPVPPTATPASSDSTESGS
jgi:hypothetical protein